MTTARKIRVWLILFIVCLVLSGVTAFPLETELRFGSWLLHATPFAEWMPELTIWIDRVRDALVATNDDYPFLAYGTDWLAFAHLVIAVAFVGPLRDPVRNVWVIQFGMIACVGVIPLALIAGAVRGIPLGWQLLDMCFGVIGIIPLLIVYRLIRRLEREQVQVPPPITILTPGGSFSLSRSPGPGELETLRIERDAELVHQEAHSSWRGLSVAPSTDGILVWTARRVIVATGDSLFTMSFDEDVMSAASAGDHIMVVCETSVRLLDSAIEVDRYELSEQVIRTSIRDNKIALYLFGGASLSIATEGRKLVPTYA